MFIYYPVVVDYEHDVVSGSVFIKVQGSQFDSWQIAKIPVFDN